MTKAEAIKDAMRWSWQDQKDSVLLESVQTPGVFNVSSVDQALAEHMAKDPKWRIKGLYSWRGGWQGKYVDQEMKDAHQAKIRDFYSKIR